MPNSFNSNMPLLPRAIYKPSTVRVVTNFDLGCTHFATFFLTEVAPSLSFGRLHLYFGSQSPISLFVRIAHLILQLAQVYHAQAKTENQTQTLQIHSLSSTCCPFQISKTPNCSTTHALENLKYCAKTHFYKTAYDMLF